MFNKIKLIINRIIGALEKSKFVKCGGDVKYSPLNSVFSFETISIGSRVFIGPYAYFRSTHGVIEIGSNVMFGPSVYILGGDHIYDRCGEYMIDVKKGRDHCDSPVVIEDDTWIGARATILSGVRVGVGSIVAAGCLVTRDVPPYEIHGGVPNRKIGERFTAEEIDRHHQMLAKKHA